MSRSHWEVLTESVQGVNKRCNQDWCAADGDGSAEAPLILAVADGHGSAAHARSDVGSRLAVDRFTALARELLGFAGGLDAHDPHRLRKVMSYAQHDLPRRLAASWRDGALGHWGRHPDPAAVAPTDAEKLLLYGTTLIGAVLTPQLFAAWQLGDGDLTVVEADGTVTRPLASTEADLGDETESLCTPGAWRLVRVHWAPLFDPERAPRLVSLSTDGLSKSFASPAGFVEFIGGLDQRLQDEGPQRVGAALPGWLAEAAKYSGDDTTLAAGLRTQHHAAPRAVNRQERTDPAA